MQPRSRNREHAPTGKQRASEASGGCKGRPAPASRVDNATDVRGDLPTTRNVLHQARHDHEEEHRKKLQDPPGRATKLDHHLHHHPHAMVQQALHPVGPEPEAQREGHLRDGEDGDRDVPVRGGDGDSSPDREVAAAHMP